MSYDKLMEIEDIEDVNSRLIKHANYYSSTELNGLHYVNFDKDTNTLSISCPNHRTHHLATSFLIKEKKSNSINTVKKRAYDLKKFLDFLLIWNIDLLECDLLNLISGFVSYLRCIDPSPAPLFSDTMIFYSTLKKLPLNVTANSLGKVIKIGYQNNGFMASNSWEDSSYIAIRNIVSSSIKYIRFLKEKSTMYKSLNTDEFPVKAVKKQSALSGTLRSNSTVKVIDTDFILLDAGMKKKRYSSAYFSLDLKVLQLEEIDEFMDSLASDNYQNKLLFTILKCFGLREGEASSLQVDVSKLSQDFMYMDFNDAIEHLKKNLAGDIEYDSRIEKWICHVNPNASTKYNQQSKTGARSIPLVFTETNFEFYLFYGLVERQILMSRDNREHNFLFVSRSSKDERGNPITGDTVYTRFKYYADKLNTSGGIDLTDYSPHSMRHFFATHLIRTKKYNLLDVSKFLGHTSELVTLKTYYHFMDLETLELNVSKDILEKFRKEVDKTNGMDE